MLIVWVIGQWLKDPVKSEDMTQHGLLECRYKLIFFSIFCIPHACFEQRVWHAHARYRTAHAGDSRPNMRHKRAYLVSYFFLTSS